MRMLFSVLEWEGEVLEMARISRLDMGAYLCIASNGVPPTVSKRVKVSVDCELTFENKYSATNVAIQVEHISTKFDTNLKTMVITVMYRFYILNNWLEQL